MLGNLAEATSCYTEVLVQDDTNTDALRALDRLYQVQGSWHELADNLSRQLTLVDDPAATIDLLVRLAHLRETFDDPDLDREVGLLWLGEEFAQLDSQFCDWRRSGDPEYREPQPRHRGGDGGADPG